MKDTTDIVSYNGLPVGDKSAWESAVREYGGKTALAEFKESSFGRRLPEISHARPPKMHLDVMVKGWLQKPSRKMWDMLQVSEEGAHFPVEHFRTDNRRSNGYQNFTTKPSMFFNILLTPEEDENRASVVDIADALRESEQYEYTNAINLELLFVLLGNGITRAETDRFFNLNEHDKVLRYRTKPNNLYLYPDFVATVRDRSTALSWLILLDDVSVVYKDKPLLGYIELEALAALDEHYATPEEYLILRRGGSTQIEVILDAKINNIDSQLMEALMRGGRPGTSEHSKLLELLAQNGISPLI